MDGFQTTWVEGASLISEKSFASNYPSVWKELTPFADAFVRDANERTGRISGAPGRIGTATVAAFVSEFAFDLAVQSYADVVKLPRAEWHGALRHQAELAWKDIDPNDLITVKQRFGHSSEVITRITSFPQAIRIAESIVEWVESNKGRRRVSWKPSFKGCGLVDSCVGDLSLGSELVEFKAAERTFRIVDFRQVLIYMSLSYLEKGDLWRNARIVNLWTGKEIRLSADEFAVRIAGTTAIDLFNSILEAMESARVTSSD